MLLLFSCSVVSDSFATPRTVTRKAPLSMGFPRHEYRRGLPSLSPEGIHFLHFIFGVIRGQCFYFITLSSSLSLKINAYNNQKSQKSLRNFKSMVQRHCTYGTASMFLIFLKQAKLMLQNQVSQCIIKSWKILISQSPCQCNTKSVILFSA